jgi:hypothetical protein
MCCDEAIYVTDRISYEIPNDVNDDDNDDDHKIVIIMILI